jgi:hypothetical protein
VSRDDVVSLIVRSPWWVVVGLVSGGAFWASDIQGEVREVKQQIRDLPETRRQLDSVRIELRHISGTLDEVRALLGRQTVQDGSPLQGAR